MARTPWMEAVAYTSVRTAGDVTVGAGAFSTAFSPAFAVAGGLLADGCYRVTAREAARSNGVYTANDVRVSLPNPMPDPIGEPKPRDTVAWKGRTYVVLDVAGSDWFPGSPFWVVTARCPQVAYDLRDTADVLRPLPQPGGGGLRRWLSAAEVLAAGIDCRLQPEAVGAEPETGGKLTTRTRYKCYLAGTVRLRAGDAVRVDSVLYEVKGQGDIDSLGLITVADVERID
jgi:hypothetical protein